MTLRRASVAATLALTTFAAAPAAPGSEAAAVVQAFGLQGWRVTFKDETGRTISAARFGQVVANKWLAVSKDEVHQTAVVRLAPSAPRNNAPPLAVQVGDTMPRLAGTLIDGKATTVAADGSHYTLLAFFFAGCAPCVAEIPALNQLQAARPDVQVIGVTFDPLPTTRMLAAKRGIRYATLSDARASIDALKLQGYPTLALLKPDGTVAAVKQGSEMGGAAAAAPVLADWVAQAITAAPARPH